MPITVKSAKLWRADVPNTPGTLAQVLEPLAAAGADLQVVMAYRYPADQSMAAVEVYPVAGKATTRAASAAGLTGSEIPMLCVVGDNRPGLGAGVARAMSDAGINLTFLVAQVMGRKYSAVFGFENADDARKGAALIKKAAAPKAKARTVRRKTVRR